MAKIRVKVIFFATIIWNCVQHCCCHMLPDKNIINGENTVIDVCWSICCLGNYLLLSLSLYSHNIIASIIGIAVIVVGNTTCYCHWKYHCHCNLNYFKGDDKQKSQWWKKWLKETSMANNKMEYFDVLTFLDRFPPWKDEIFYGSNLPQSDNYAMLWCHEIPATNLIRVYALKNQSTYAGSTIYLVHLSFMPQVHHVVNKSCSWSLWLHNFQGSKWITQELCSVPFLNDDPFSYLLKPN